MTFCYIDVWNDTDFLSKISNVFSQYLLNTKFLCCLLIFLKARNLKGAFFHQISCTVKYYSIKLSLKKYVCQDWRGEWKITLLLKDPVGCQVATLFPPLINHAKHKFALMCFIFVSKGKVKILTKPLSWKVFVLLPK